MYASTRNEVQNSAVLTCGFCRHSFSEPLSSEIPLTIFRCPICSARLLAVTKAYPNDPKNFSESAAALFRSLSGKEPEEPIDIDHLPFRFFLTMAEFLCITAWLPDEYLTPMEVAQILHRSLGYIENMASSGELKVQKADITKTEGVHGRWLISRKSLHDFIEQRNEFTEIHSFIRGTSSGWSLFVADVHYHDIKVVFETSQRNGDLCESFYIMPNNEDFVIAQVHITKSGMVTCNSFFPCEIDVKPEDKEIFITISTDEELLGKVDRYLHENYLPLGGFCPRKCLNEDEPTDDVEWSYEYDRDIINISRFGPPIFGGEDADTGSNFEVPFFFAPRRAIFLRMRKTPSEPQDGDLQETDDYEESTVLMALDPPAEEQALHDWIDHWVRSVADQENILIGEWFEIWILEDAHVVTFRTWTRDDDPGTSQYPYNRYMNSDN